MSRLLRAELVKLRTTRTFLALAGVAAGLTLLVAVLITSLGDPASEDLTAAVGDVNLGTLFIPILGIVGITGEWRHRTITSSLLAAPDRLRFLAAKVIAYAVAGVVLALAISVLAMVVGSIILAARGSDVPGVGDALDAIWPNLLTAALLGALGVGLGTLIRNQAVAVVSVLVIFIVELTLTVFIPDVTRYGPFSATSAVLAGEADLTGDGLLSRGAGTLVLLAWIAVTATLGGLLLRRRDVGG